MDLKTQTTEQLKALAYDQIVALERAKSNLAIIQAEQGRRAAAGRGKCNAEPATSGQ